MSAEDTAASVASALVAGKALQVPTAGLQECERKLVGPLKNLVIIRFILALLLSIRLIQRNDACSFGGYRMMSLALLIRADMWKAARRLVRFVLVLGRFVGCNRLCVCAVGKERENHQSNGIYHVDATISVRFGIHIQTSDLSCHPCCHLHLLTTCPLFHARLANIIFAFS